MEEDDGDGGRCEKSVLCTRLTASACVVDEDELADA